MIKNYISYMETTYLMDVIVELVSQPFWVMKSVKERHLQRLVQLSADLARHVSVLLDSTKNVYCVEV